MRLSRIDQKILKNRDFLAPAHYLLNPVLGFLSDAFADDDDPLEGARQSQLLYLQIHAALESCLSLLKETIRHLRQHIVQDQIETPTLVSANTTGLRKTQ